MKGEQNESSQNISILIIVPYMVLIIQPEVPKLINCHGKLTTPQGVVMDITYLCIKGTRSLHQFEIKKAILSDGFCFRQI